MHYPFPLEFRLLPFVDSLATNDALSANLVNIGKLSNRKNTEVTNKSINYMFFKFFFKIIF